ncbi:MAG: hypothetical protein IIY78_08465 [Clostridia bacterium]|nr:hypothetical protein [Clostridia bacterium]
MESREIPEINYQRLADEIVIRAVKDYRKALRTLKYHPENDTARRSKREVEKFFNSQWFGVLTEIDPEVLISRLRKEVGV